ncbi:MAG: polyhydroxyalkanoate synthesis repressor PhaR [Pseudomonadota bacterium]
MVTEQSPIVIKKYANRRLYNTRTSAYVTLDDLAAMVRNGDEFVVQDAKSGEDITRGVLGQIIFDAESRGGGLLPIAFLRQLITFYGGQMQTIVPTYLEHALATFAREQENFGRQMNQAIGAQAFTVVEDQVRRNMEMFERSMRMFMPYAGESGSPSAGEGNGNPAHGTAAPHNSSAAERAGDDAHLAQDVAALRSELASMQAKVEALSKPAETAAPAKPAPSKAVPSLEDDGEEDDGFIVDSVRSGKA